MTIDPNSVIRGFERLQGNGAQVQQAAQAALTRKVLDTAESATMTLLQSLEPNLGRHVDVRV